MHHVKTTLDSSKKLEKCLLRSCYQDNLEVMLHRWLERVFYSLVHKMCHARLLISMDRSKFLVRDFLQVCGIKGYGSAFESLFEHIAGRLQRAGVLHFDMERMLHRSVREEYIMGASRSILAHFWIVGLKQACHPTRDILEPNQEYIQILLQTVHPERNLVRNTRVTFTLLPPGGNGNGQASSTPPPKFTPGPAQGHPPEENPVRNHGSTFTLLSTPPCKLVQCYRQTVFPLLWLLTSFQRLCHHNYLYHRPDLRFRRQSSRWPSLR